MVTALMNAQSEYDKVELQVQATKAVREVGKSRTLRKELLQIYDLFLRYTAASAEAYPDKTHFTKLLKELNAIRSSQRSAEKISKRNNVKHNQELNKSEGK